MEKELFMIFEREGEALSWMIVEGKKQALSFLLSRDIVVYEFKTNDDYGVDLTMSDFNKTDYFEKNGCGYIRLEMDHMLKLTTHMFLREVNKDKWNNSVKRMNCDPGLKVANKLENIMMD